MTRKSERTRSRIVQAANRLFYRKGYNRTSFSDVVDAAGVPRGNIYYYFKTKDDILRAAIEYRTGVIRSMIDEWNRKYDTPTERLKRFLQVLANSREAMASWGCPNGTLNMELGKDQRDLQVAASRLFELFENWLAEQFTLLGYKFEAQTLAQRLMARGQGLSLVAHVHQDPDFLQEEVTELMHWIDELADNAPASK